MQENDFSQALHTSKTQMQECQSSHSLSSCLQCPQILQCPTREEYVKATYSYLNKGEDGEFEF